MTPAAAERMRVYQEGQRSACDDDAVCPYAAGDWRVMTWIKGRQAAQNYWREVEEIEDRIADQQVRDIAAGVGLPPAESSAVPDPILDCDCGRRWCWTDGAGWNAKHVEQREVEGVDPISGLPFKVTLKSTIAQQQAEPVELTSEWQACTKLPVTVHVRSQKPGEKHISTREGITPIEPDDLIMRGVQGEEYPIGREIFSRTYRLGEAEQAEPVVAPVVERVVQFRKRHCADWYDGHADHEDGGGPYEERVLYTHPPQRAEPVQAEPVELTDAAIEAAITAWFGWRMSDDSDHAPFRGETFPDRMRAAIKAAQDFKEAT